MLSVAYPSSLVFEMPGSAASLLVARECRQLDQTAKKARPMKMRTPIGTPSPIPIFAPRLRSVESELSAEFVDVAAAADAVVGDKVIALVTMTVAPPATVVGEPLKDGLGVTVTVAAAVGESAFPGLSARNRAL